MYTIIGLAEICKMKTCSIILLPTLISVTYLFNELVYKCTVNLFMDEQIFVLKYVLSLLLCLQHIDTYPTTHSICVLMHAHYSDIIIMT